MERGEGQEKEKKKKTTSTPFPSTSRVYRVYPLEQRPGNLIPFSIYLNSLTQTLFRPRAPLDLPLSLLGRVLLPYPALASPCFLESADATAQPYSRPPRGKRQYPFPCISSPFSACHFARLPRREGGRDSARERNETQRWIPRWLGSNPVSRENIFPRRQAESQQSTRRDCRSFFLRREVSCASANQFPTGAPPPRSPATRRRSSAAHRFPFLESSFSALQPRESTGKVRGVLPYCRLFRISVNLDQLAPLPLLIPPASPPRELCY